MEMFTIFTLKTHITDMQVMITDKEIIQPAG